MLDVWSVTSVLLLAKTGGARGLGLVEARSGQGEFQSQEIGNVSFVEIIIGPQNPSVTPVKQLVLGVEVHVEGLEEVIMTDRRS